MSEREQVLLHTARPLPEYLSLLAKNRSTGTLVVTSEAARRDLVFVNGELRAASSSVEEEKLGLWLVSRARISDGERALGLLAQGGEQAPPLGHVLVRRGCIDLRSLEHELEELTLTIVRRAAAAATSYCEFRDGLRSTQLDTLPNFTTGEAILIAAREFPDLDAKLRAIGSLGQVAWLASPLDALLHELTLTPSEAFVLSRLDGSRNLQGLLAVLPLARDEVLSTLYALKVAGIVQIGSIPLATPTPTLMPSQRRQQTEQHVFVVDENQLSPEQLKEREEIRALAERLPHLDHYHALGLRNGASDGLVRESWERFQRRFDPQRSTEPHLRDLRAQLSAVVERAGEAFEVLSNPAARRRYDQILESIENEHRPRSSPYGDLREPDPKAREELAEANFRRAEELERDGEVYLAIRLLEQACAMEPRPAGLLQLARLLMRNPLWSNRALDCLRKALQVDSGLVEGWIELAEFWRRRNNSERQRKALERALQANPDEPRAAQLYRQLVGRRELERLQKLVREHRR